MNASALDARQRAIEHEHLLDTVHAAMLDPATPRSRVWDRLAMRLGLWLLIRSTRSEHHVSHEYALRARENSRARDRRELDHARALVLLRRW